jgi:hypothetical protein
VNLARHQLLTDAAFAFDEHGEVGVRDPLDAVAEQTHHIAGADERSSSVALRRGQRRRRGGEPLGFEEESRNACRSLKQLAGPVVWPVARIEGHFEHHLAALLAHRDREGDVVPRANRLQRLDRHRAGDFVQPHAAHAGQLGEALREEHPEVAAIIRIQQIGNDATDERLDAGAPIGTAAVTLF